ncbi:MAG: alpha/beta hydrolase [Gammaproteobacteria bacterium]|nr:alpha/beta hydrolase [Gammaproteobacteria bacterium]
MAIGYDPSAEYEIRIWEETFRETPHRTLMARICQPQGNGPFPVLLDLHGGAWNFKDRMANTQMAEAIARSGMLVVSVDMRLAGEAPYPASVQDACYAVRWLKLRAADWNADPATLGLLGSSSGGHVAQLIAMRPDDPRYNAIELSGHPAIDSHVRYVATRSPISDPLARYENAVRRERAEMIGYTKTYFDPWESIEEANPQHMLDRGEPVNLPPMLIMQGGDDDNVLPEFQERFATSYRAAGGECQLEVFSGSGHLWVLDSGPQTELAHDVVKAFIARQLAGDTGVD